MGVSAASLQLMLQPAYISSGIPNSPGGVWRDQIAVTPPPHRLYSATADGLLLMFVWQFCS